MTACSFQVRVTPRTAVQVQVAGSPTVVYGVAAGPAGPMGPINAGFQWNQPTPAATWSITHTLGRYPLSCEITINGEVVYSDVEYPDPFTVVVTFASPQAGTLRLT
jgi:hypothetical protein